ncbi:helicase-exonuclease AddAB subunit AddB [uncultured Clostridium sp.]|uniref:helicase-exonuclease AddAB subunit AddB n=1 Tax=uncultured Clostridium sp. TaxID=59620 RepID=UPI00280AC1A5|nr:helicase-exonuclease AddAB subunit AddB [uncultured Clostridium sp.]MDU1349794.1 helicase-exonuclease AddAB subunit AddB [Clostridium argentinense]
MKILSLRFIFGGAGSGKSYQCMEEIKRKKENGADNSLILLVPEQLSFRAEKLLVEKIGATGINNVYVLSFKRMAHTVFSEVGGITHAHMSSTGKAMIIDKIMKEIQEELKIFSLASRQKGFVETISETINEFKRYNVSVEVLNSLKENITDSSLIADKLSDISLIYGKYEEVLKSGYFDPEDDLTILYNKIDKSELFKGAEIWIDEFSGFTPQQYKIIEKLFKVCKRVNITLPYEGSVVKGIVEGEIDSTDAFYTVYYTEKTIVKIAGENNIGYDKPLILKGNPKNQYNYRFINSEELGYLEKNYFLPNSKPYEGNTKDIKIFKALNTYSEIEYVAREILQLCREKNYRFNDIAIVARDLNSYEEIVKAVFDEYEIPYFLDRKKDIDTNPVIILIKSSLEIFTKNFSYESVFRYLKSGLLDLTYDEIDILENYVLAYGIKGKKRYMNDDYWKDDTVKDIKNKFINPLINFRNKITSKSQVKDICKAIFEFLEEIQIHEKLTIWIENFREDKNLIAVNEYSSIWNLLIELLDQFVEVLGDEILPLDKFIEIFSMGISTHEIGLIPPALDQVIVGNIDRIRTHEIKALYVIGVNDGVFPKIINEEGIFTDMDRAVFESNGIKLANDTKALAFAEQYLIYSTLTVPSEKLCLSYPIANFEGKTLRPSIIIPRIKSIFKDIKEESNIAELWENHNSIEKVSAKLPSFNELIMEIRKFIDNNEISPLWEEIYRWFMEDEQFREKSKRIFQGFSYKNIINAINSEKIRKLYGGNNYFSVSKIEKYVQCPFAYFIQYGLKAKERKIYSFSAPDLGTFMHSVLDTFSKKIEKDNLKWKELTNEYCEKNIEHIVELMVSEDKSFILNSSARYKYITERLKRVLIRAVMVIVEQLRVSGFEPQGYEISFGLKDTDYPPIVLKLSSGETVRLMGRIDRIDKLVTNNEVYYRIVDYKSGNKDFKLSDVYYGLQVQLLTYLDAILSNDEKNSTFSKPAGVLYFKIDDPIISIKKDSTDEEIEAEILKELKMKGLLIKDIEILREMDKSMENGSNSSVIPAGIKKDGELTSVSSVISYEGFNALRNHVKEELAKSCEEMLSGEIGIKPYKRGEENPCSFCKLSPICQFDLSFEENKFRLIREKKDKEILEILEKKGDSSNGQ